MAAHIDTGGGPARAVMAPVHARATRAAYRLVLAVTPARVYELVRCGLIPHVRIGRQVRIDPDRLEDWIAAGGQALPGRWRRAAEDDAT